MKISHVELNSPRFSENIKFSMKNNRNSERYTVRTIVGLDSDEIIPKFYANGLVSQNKFYDLNRKAREIVIRVSLNLNIDLDETYSDIRDELYRTISATRTGEVTLYLCDGPVIIAGISGFITKFEIPYFNQLPEAQITISCDDGLFRGLNPIEYDDDDLPDDFVVVLDDSRSTAPHGLTIKVVCTGATSNFTIRENSTDPDWRFRVSPFGGFEVGDELYLSNEGTKKELYLVRTPDTIHLLDRVTPGSVWPIIFPGINELFFSDQPNFDWTLISYKPVYWGV